MMQIYLVAKNQVGYNATRSCRCSVSIEALRRPVDCCRTCPTDSPNYGRNRLDLTVEALIPSRNGTTCFVR